MKLTLVIVVFYFFVSNFIFAATDDCPPSGNYHKYLDTPLDFKNPEQRGTFKLHYKLQNGLDLSKKTLVMLHGGPGGSLESWDTCPAGYCLNQLEEKYNIITMDERGSGCSLLPQNMNDEFLTITATAEDLEWLRTSLLGLDGKLSLMGVSFGTVVAVVYTSRHDENVEHLILESSPYDNEYMVNVAFEENFNLMLDKNPLIKKGFKELYTKLETGELKISRNDFFGMRDVLAYSYNGLWKLLPSLILQLNIGNYTMWGKLDEVVGDSALRMLASPAYDFIMCRELFDFNFPQFRLKDQMDLVCSSFKDVNHEWLKYRSEDYIQKINTPTLLLTGTWDSATVPANSYRMAEGIKNSRVCEVPYTGHSVLWENNACDVHLISSFLENGLTDELEQILNHEECQQTHLTPGPMDQLMHFIQVKSQSFELDKSMLPGPSSF